MSDQKNKQKQHGYWRIRVYYDGKPTPSETLGIAGKDQAREQYEEEIQKLMRDPAHALWRVELVYCVVTETVWEQDWTMY
jgi:hypothetical protein